MTQRIRSAAVPAAAVALLFSACGGEPTSSATTTSSTAPASAPAATSVPAATPAPGPTADLAQVTAVANRIFPAGNSQDCFDGGFNGCPFTPRLKARMQAIIGASTGGGGDPVCRCQNSYTSAAVTAGMASGQPVAHVVLTFGQSSVKMDWVFVQSGGAWLADDSYCSAQGPSTSIYSQSHPCSG